MSTTILVIEDDPAIRTGVVDMLGAMGFSTLAARDGHQGLDLALKGSYDLALLDIVMPGPDGLEILKAIRQTRPTTPVIMLSALGTETDRVRGLHLGADDYMVKPFGARELLARIQAVMRRSPERPQMIECVNFSTCVARLDHALIEHHDGSQEKLSEREVALLRYLAQHRGRVISRDEILERVWRLNHQGHSTRTIDMHIAHLRAKLRDDSDEPQLLQTVRGRGYLLTSATG